MASPTTPLASNLEKVQERIARAAERAGRNASDTTLVAVSKTFPAEEIRAAYDLGLRHFGENRVQEWELKRPLLADLNATWHLVGHLQSNKARRAATLCRRVDSVDSIALAQKLDSAAAEERKRLEVLIAVHLGGEETKSGIAENDLLQLAESIAQLPNLQLLGLMTIPPYFEQTEEVRPFFRRLRELRDTIGGKVRLPLATLSMGMSHDFEVAIEEGATEIRIGTALFGERSKKL